MRMLLAVSMVFVFAPCAFALTPASQRPNDQSAKGNAVDVSTARVVPVANPGHPYLDKSIQPPKVAALKLRVADSKANQITDDEAWFDSNGFERQNRLLAPGYEQMPQRCKFGTLKFYRPLPEGAAVAVYELAKPRKDAAKDKGLGGIYDQEFSYTAVAVDALHNALAAWDLEAFFPGILEMSNVETSGFVLYFDSNYNGYASIAGNKTGYLNALDLTDGKVLWTTPALTASFRGFLVMEEHIIAGYGFTAEPDFLFVINRHTGLIEQKQKLKSAHDYIFRRGNRLYVRCYDTDYVFEF